MSFESGNKYKITNVKGGTVLDLSGADNKSIIGYGFHDGANQQWELQATGAGWTFKNVGTGLYLSVDGDTQDGQSVIASSNASEWKILPDDVDGSVHRIFVPGTNHNVDLSNHGSSTPGTPVVIWAKWDGANQTWRFEQV